MADDDPLPLRPALDPQVLQAQLTGALRELRGDRYQGYLAQAVRACFLAIHDGDLDAPQASLDLLAPALHLGERLIGSAEAREAAAWVRATSRFFEVAKEALAPRHTIESLVQRERSETEREVLQTLLHTDSMPLRRGEIAARWSAQQPPPTTMRIGQILASLHEAGIVVRVKQRARGGSDVAFYRLSRLGRELCEELRLRRAMPDNLVDQAAFYERLNHAMRADTAEPLYLTTYTNLDERGHARDAHDQFLADIGQIQRPIHWIFLSSTYFREVFHRTAAARVQFYVVDEVRELEPTIQVLGDVGCIYPIAPKTALAVTNDVGLATWTRQRSRARELN